LDARAEALRELDATSPTGSKEAARLYTNRALALAKSHQLHAAQHAVQDSTAALQADPAFAKALYRRAVARQMLGDVAGAAADCVCAERLMSAAGDDASEVTALLQQLQLAQPAEQHNSTAADAPGVAMQASAAAAEKCSSSSALAPQAAHAAHAAAVGQPSSQGNPAPGLPGMHAEQQAVHAASQGLLRAGHSSTAGRHLLAAADIAAGTSVLQEGPVAAVIMQHHRESR
jgi:hypothetical protein